jgi:hypothetical protein
MYDLMVRAVVLGDTRDYIALAITMAHYVGDACQPLHLSRFHHGRPGHPDDSNVHGDYETKMLDRFAAELVDKVNTAIGTRRVTAHIAGGDAAAALVVDLMDRTIQRLSPEVVVNAWIATKGHNHISDLWNLVGDDTAACIAEGALWPRHAVGKCLGRGRRRPYHSGRRSHTRRKQEFVAKPLQQCHLCPVGLAQKLVIDRAATRSSRR